MRKIMEENKNNEKKMVQVGVSVKRIKTRLDATKTEPIYAEWTPELQAANDQARDALVRIMYDEIQKYIANGGDLSKLDTPEGQEHFRQYQQKQIDERKRKAELRKIKNRMTDEELEEFIKWKESKKS